MRGSPGGVAIQAAQNFGSSSTCLALIGRDRTKDAVNSLWIMAYSNDTSGALENCIVGISNKRALLRVL